MTSPTGLNERHPPAARTLESRLAGWTARPAVWLALAALLMAMQIKSFWVPSDDDTSFYSIARHISDGELQRFGSDYLHMQPGYPLLIAPAFWTGERPFLAISLINFGLALVFIATMWRWARRLTPGLPGAAAMLVLLAVVNASLWRYHGRILSEAAFVPLMIVTALVLQRALTGATVRRRVTWLALGALALAFLTLVRLPGVLIAPGFAIAAAITAAQQRASWKWAASASAVALIVAVAVASSWIVYQQSVRDPALRTHLGLMERTTFSPLKRVTRGVHIRLSEVGQMMTPGLMKGGTDRGEWLHHNTAIFLLVTIGLTIGWWRMARHRGDVLLWTLPCYVLFFIVAWPYSQGTRFMLPMLPVWVVGLWGLVEPLRRHRLSIVVILIIAHFAVAAAYWTRERTHRDYERYWPQLEQVRAVIGDDASRAAGLGLHEDVRGISVIVFNGRITPPRAPGNREAQPAADVLWLLTPADADPGAPPGFTEALRTADLRLLKRDRF